MAEPTFPSFLPSLLSSFLFWIFVILKPDWRTWLAPSSLDLLIPNRSILSLLPRVFFALSFSPLLPWQHPRYYFISHSPSLFPSFQPEAENRIGFQRWHEWPRNPSFPSSFFLLCLSPFHDFSDCSASLPEFPRLFTTSCNKTSKLFRGREAAYRCTFRVNSRGIRENLRQEYAQLL